jgi:hypothetical protein
VSNLPDAATRYRWTVAAVVTAAGIILIGFGIAATNRVNSTEFLLGLLATFAGVIAGVPVALALAEGDRIAARAAEKVREDDRRDDVLRLIHTDLCETLQQLLGLDRQSRQEVVAPFLGSGLWSALASSGELALLAGDPKLLRDVSRAYDRIALTSYLEQQLWETFYSPEARRRTHPPSTLLQEVSANVAEQDEHTKAAIDVAIGRIRTATGISSCQDQPSDQPEQLIAA